MLNLEHSRKLTATKANADDANMGMGLEKWTDYFGENSKKDFYRLYKQAGRNLIQYPDEGDLPDELKTPRSTYLRTAEKACLLPIPAILRKIDVSASH